MPREPDPEEELAPFLEGDAGREDDHQITVRMKKQRGRRKDGFPKARGPLGDEPEAYLEKPVDPEAIVAAAAKALGGESA